MSFVSIGEAAVLLGVSGKTLRRWEKSAEFQLANQENSFPDGLDDSEDVPF